MTYRELAQIISEKMTDDQKNCDVTVYYFNIDEFYSCRCIELSEEDDVLDKDHPYLVF